MYLVYNYLPFKYIYLKNSTTMAPNSGIKKPLDTDIVNNKIYLVNNYLSILNIFI